MPVKKKKKKMIAVAMDFDALPIKKLDQIAKSQNLPRAWFLRKIVNDWVDGAWQKYEDGSPDLEAYIMGKSQ